VTSELERLADIKASHEESKRRLAQALEAEGGRDD